MSLGRLIRVKNFRGDPDAVVYALAEPDPVRAIEILKAAGLPSATEFEDLGRISDSLLSALEMTPGQFKRISPSR